jgi:hypothetical protein
MPDELCADAALLAALRAQAALDRDALAAAGPPPQLSPAALAALAATVEVDLGDALTGEGAPEGD